MVTALIRLIAIQQSLQVTLSHLIASNSYVEPEVVVPEEPAKPRKVYKNQALGWAAYEIATGAFMGIFIPSIARARNFDCWS